MTFPVYFSWFGVSLHPHVVLELAAYGAGFSLYFVLRRRWPSGPAMTWMQTGWLMVGAILGALFGARGVAWLEALPLYLGQPVDWHLLPTGKSIVGALLGGWGGVELAKRRLGLFHPSGDVFVFPLLLGMAIGRVGCLLTGLEDGTYGLATSLPWGIDFGDGVKRHPAPLYEILFLAGLAVFFVWRIRTGRQRGCMFSQFLLGYLAYRFCAEFLKPRVLLPGLPLTAIQSVCAMGVVWVSRHLNDACCGLPSAGAQRSRHLDPPPAPGEERFEELTNSLCPHCLKKVEAKVLVGPNGVFLQKFCPDHGSQRVLVAHDAVRWQRMRHCSKPPTSPLARQTEARQGCPWDCGLCPDHEQHSCLALIEITDQCQLACPVCYARSDGHGAHRSLSEIEAMLDAVVASEGEVSVVQISGGEPTLHPELGAVLAAARRRPIRHLMLNTNGVRLAEDPDLVARLAANATGSEIYLQFDTLRPAVSQRLRGADLVDVKQRALAALDRHGISTTLVATVVRGLNDDEIGDLIRLAVSHRCVRGVTLQPVQGAGRLRGLSAEHERITLTEVRSAVLDQQSYFTDADLVPVPCHGDALMMAYGLRTADTVTPLSTWTDPGLLIAAGGNTISYEQDPALRDRLVELFSLSSTGSAAAHQLQALCCAAGAAAPSLGYDRIFRVIIMQFMDAWNMDLRSLKRSCVHMVAPDGRLIPFETYNLFHRATARMGGPNG